MGIDRYANMDDLRALTKDQLLGLIEARLLVFPSLRDVERVVWQREVDRGLKIMDEATRGIDKLGPCPATSNPALLVEHITKWHALQDRFDEGRRVIDSANARYERAKT